MFRVLSGVMVISLCLCGVPACRDCEASKRDAPPHVWWAPDSSWAVGGFGKLRPGFCEEIIAKKPAGMDGLKAYELQLEEPGEWLGFSIAFKRVKKIVVTKSTRIVLIDTSGNRIESEAIVFYPDLLQTSLYDSRRSPVVVTENSVWCNPKNGYPSGFAKFPAGSIEVKRIASFEVLGAVVDTVGQRRNEGG